MSYQKKLLNRFSEQTIHIMLMIFCFSVTSILHAQQIDILLKGGHVIDPKNKIDGQMDVAITQGKIFQVAKNLPPQQAKQVIEGRGLKLPGGIGEKGLHPYTSRTHLPA